jgi:hypothetical protein
MEACRRIIEPQLDLFRQAGVLAAELPAPPDATAETRFLAMLGRSNHHPGPGTRRGRQRE